LNAVAAVGLSHDEVGEADEAVFGERGWNDDRGARRERRERGAAAADGGGVAHVGVARPRRPRGPNWAR
jgi:hypothetical protein